MYVATGFIDDTQASLTTPGSDFTIGLVLNPPASAADIEPKDLALVRRFSYCTIVSFMLMYTSLFFVKLSFLLFFYRLGPKLIQNIKWHWWIVAIFTFAAYIATFATYPYKCSFGSLEQISSSYCTAEQNMAFLNMKVNTTLDVLTDLLSRHTLTVESDCKLTHSVVTIPLNILRRSRIPRRQSLALGGVFSLVLVTITFAIVRATVTTAGVQRQMDIPWVMVWSSAEANIAIVVVCIGSFRMLFVQNRKEERSPVGDVGQRRRVEKTSTFTFGASVEEAVDSEPGQSRERGSMDSMGRVESTVATETDRRMGTARSVSSSAGSNAWQTTQGSSVLDWERAARSS